ncbi:MAG: hypothetical protein HQK65_15215 [Desulfamplus sp.]|nr:hypothetical protein [Desulfamplus sp.]
MLIANPIYDVVFKYLLDDNEVAKLLISELLGKEIEELVLYPQERVIKSQAHSFTVFRLDFAATIREKGGEYKRVIIEIQKAKFQTDIMRFRKYLGEQYINSGNSYVVKYGKDGDKENKKAMPIISIYFLGHPLSEIKSSIIRIERNYLDGVTKEKIEKQDEFIESLTHDSIIVQIPSLGKNKRTELEQLLSIFDQANKFAKSQHIMQINEDEYPLKYRKIIRRLQKAAEDKEVADIMELEDEILEELAMKDRQIGNKEKLIEEKDKALEEKDKALEEKDKALEENRKALEDKDKALEENRKVIEYKEKLLTDLMKRVAALEKDK